MIDHKQMAVENCRKGYNCAQSVFMAFCDVTGLAQDEALKLSSGFGGGMGGMKEVCGVLTGAFMVLGSKLGFSSYDDPEEKKKFYALIKSFADEFNDKYGSLLCRELEENAKCDSFLKGEQDNEFFNKKPCAVYMEYSAQLLDEYLNKLK